MSAFKGHRRLKAVQETLYENLKELELAVHHKRYALMEPVRKLANETSQHFVTIMDKDHGADNTDGRWAIQGVPAWSSRQPILIRNICLWMDILEGDPVEGIRQARILVCADSGNGNTTVRKTTEVAIPQNGEAQIVTYGEYGGWEYHLRRFPSQKQALQYVTESGGKIED